MALTDQLVAYYKLDEASGNAADSVASQTLTNVGTTPYTACLINNGADFGTVDAHSKKLDRTTDGFGVDLGTAYSLSFWTKVRTAPGSGLTRRFIDWRSTAGTSAYLLCDYNNNAGTLRLQINSSGTNTNYNITLSTSSFTHIVVTRGSGITLYVNGSSVATGTAANSGAGANFTIGNATGGTSVGMASYIDEVGAWSREISASEVTSLYNGGAGLAYPLTVSTPRPRKALLGVGL